MFSFILDKADVALIFSLVGISVSFFNVNRQKRATLKNDEEKFKRDHNMQTYNELVEILYELLIVIKKFRLLNYRYKTVINSNPVDIITSLNETTWGITDGWFNTIGKVGSYYTKREYVLKNFESNINNIAKLTKLLDDYLWQFKTYIWDHDENLENIKITLEATEKLGEDSINEITTLIKSLQHEFLGHIYK